MAKCKVCGYRLGDGVTKCPMCGAIAGSTVAGEISPELNLPKYFCPSCNSQILGEHRYCPSCGVDLKEATKKAENLKTQKQEFAEEKKCVNCGAVLTPNAKFCPECGAKQEVIPVEQASKEPAISKKLKKESKNKQKQGPLTTSGGLVNGQPETPMEAFEYEIEDGKYVLTKLKKKYRNLTEIVVPKIFSVIGNHKEVWEDYDPAEDDEEDKYELIGAFQDCDKLESVILPDTIEIIKEAAFYGCRNLVSINLPDTIGIIEEDAFGYCSNLVTIHIPDSLLEISYRTFGCCDKLTNVIIPPSVKRIGVAAFMGCNLTNLSFPDSLIEIGADAFSDCYNLNFVRLPNSLEKIGDRAFSISDNEKYRGCLQIENLFPSSIKEYGEKLFDETDKVKLLTIGRDEDDDEEFLDIENIDTLELPDTLETIADNALFPIQGSSRNLICCIKTLIIPESVKKIGRNAFAGFYIERVIIKNKSFNKEDVRLFLGGGYLPKELIIGGQHIEYSLSDKIFFRALGYRF